MEVSGTTGEAGGLNDVEALRVALKAALERAEVAERRAVAAENRVSQLEKDLGIVRFPDRPPKELGKAICERTEIPGLFLRKGEYYLERVRQYRTYRICLRTRSWDVAKIRYAQWEADPEGFAAEWKRKHFSSTKCESALTQFLDYKRDVQQLDPRHLDGLEATVRRFFTHCPSWVQKIRAEHVEAFIRDLNASGLAPTTVHDYHRKLSTFLTWCASKGYARTNVAKEVKPPQPIAGSTDRRRVVTVEDLNKLRFNKEVYRWMTVALYGTGVRLGELRRIMPEHVHLDANGSTGVLHIATPTKGRKSRNVPIVDEVIALALTKLCEYKVSHGRLPTDRAYEEALKAACARAEIDTVTPHALRHSWITLALAGGTDPATVQALAGHRSIKTTMAYSHPLAGKSSMPPSGLHLEEPELDEPGTPPSAPDPRPDHRRSPEGPEDPATDREL